MAYSDFTIEDLKQKFGLSLVEVIGEFAAPPIEPSDYLQETLRRNLPLATTINTEKARSEFLIAPILAELRQLRPGISLFSGVEFTVDRSLGLNGACDFLISSSSEQLVIEAPVATLVEAKKENLNGAVPQCVAEMVAAQLFNQQKGREVEAIYGVITTGSVWRFLKLQEKQVLVDLQEVYLTPLPNLLGFLLAMVEGQMVERQ